MSADKFHPHVLVLPEGDANRQLADGFLLEIPWQSTRRLEVLGVAGGWMRVLERFRSDHLGGMEKYLHRLVVLLIDFDGHDDRLHEARAVIPELLRDRVFVIGAWTEAEDLRADLGSYETIGRAIARDCRDNTDTTWGHSLLRHNADEVERLRHSVREILFG